MATVWHLVETVQEHLGHVCHRTDFANCHSIAAHGLLSRAAMAEKGVVPRFPGGNGLTRALDDDYGLGDMVFLGFGADVVMPAYDAERRIRRPVILSVDPRVLTLPGVCLSLGRANHRGSRTYALARAIPRMDLEAFGWMIGAIGGYDPNDWGKRRRLRRVRNYEILVPRCVPPEYIMEWDAG